MDERLVVRANGSFAFRPPSNGAVLTLNKSAMEDFKIMDTAMYGSASVTQLCRVTATVGDEPKYTGFAQVGDYNIFDFDPVLPSPLPTLFGQLLGKLRGTKLFPSGSPNHPTNVTADCILDGVKYVINLKNCSLDVPNIVADNDTTGDSLTIAYGKKRGP